MPLGPRRAALGDRLAPLDHCQHVGEHRLDVADDRDVDLDVFGNRRRVDIDMDDGLGVGREVGDASGHAVVEARADRHQAIGIAHRRIGAVRAVHPEHPQAQRVGGGHRAQAHQGLGHRDAHAARKLGKLGRRARPLHAAADVEQRLVALFDRLDRAFDLARIALQRRLVAAQFDSLGIFENVLGLLHVLGHVNHHRPRAAGARDVEGFLDDPCDVAHVLDQVVVLGAGARDADEIGLLERVVADHRGRHLARDNDHRGRIHVGVGDASDRVGRAGTRGDHHHARPSADARVALGHVRGALLVADQDVFNLGIEQSVVGGQNRAARITEDYVDAFGDQAFDDDLRSAKFLHRRHCCTEQTSCGLSSKVTPNAGKGSTQTQPIRSRRRRESVISQKKGLQAALSRFTLLTDTVRRACHRSYCC